MGALRWASIVAACVLAAGCFHHRAFLPGVIDMRTDGSGLPTNTRVKPDPRQVRSGSEALAEGAGVSASGGEVSVEDRHYWIVGSIPIYNESPTPELQAALTASGALTELQVGEQEAVLDVVAATFVPIVFPLASWALPSYTFTARAHARRLSPGPVDAAAPPSQAPPVTAGSKPPKDDLREPPPAVAQVTP